jgi:ABC-type sugar transport system ATPase subunit
MANITLEQLEKRFGDVTAVARIDLQIADGSFTVLLGPSGCGKTTTLNMIAGLEEPTSGRILFDADEVQEIPTHRRDIAMVFQSYALYPNRSVRDNIAFGLRVRKLPRAEIAQRVEAAAERLGLTDLLARRPRQLSGGQQQRVALARAIVRRPRVFLLDEPLSNLDAKLRGEMRAELKTLQQELAGTFVHVTHDQAEAMSMADRVVVMESGQIQQVGAPLEIYERPANLFVAGFIGSPRMNLIQGELVRGTFGASGWSYPGLPGDDGQVVLGVRPEDVRLSSDPTGAATVRFVEHLGSEVTLVAAAQFGDVVARAAPAGALAVGERVRIDLDAGRARLFDPASGAALNAD